MAGDDDGEVELGEDAAWIAAAIVLVASFSGAVVLAEWPGSSSGVEPGSSDAPRLVEPAEGGTELWPYTSRARSYGSRTLGINVVIYGQPGEVHTALTERSELEWRDEPSTEDEADSETISHERIEIDPDAENASDVVRWNPAGGSTRYAYVEAGDGGRWMDESYQLHDGTYLGQRRHIRAYEDPEGAWTAIQIHGEHWDWFRLRHTVTGISDPQRDLERTFMDEPYTEAVVRMPFGNGTADGDGWATGIYLAGLLPFVLAGAAGRARRAGRETVRFLADRRRELALGAGLFGVYTAVRWLGIAAELLAPALSPKVIAAPLYLALVAGTPAIAYAFGRGSDRVWAFTFAVFGLGAAVVVDFVAMGASVLPLRVILHRGTVLLAVGLVAVGGAATGEERRPRPLVVGAVGWGLAVGAPLFGYV
jgi:hypothetical protein